MNAERLHEGALTLAGLLRGITSVPPADDRIVTGVAMDSRRVTRGSLFLACGGERGHGLAWVDEALRRGAGAVAWEPVEGVTAPRLPGGIPTIEVADLRRRAGIIAARFFDEPSHALSVIGVTGTNGKTSVTHLLAHALSAAGRPCGVIGTLGIGMPGRLERSGHTTPDAVMVQHALAEFAAHDAAAAAMEVSSHALVQSRVAGVRFRTAVFTNLTRDHLDYHEDFESYGRAKRLLFETPELGAAVIDVDDAFGRELLRTIAPQVAATAVGTVTGAGTPADFAQRFVTIAALELHPSGMNVVLETHEGRLQFGSGLLGAFNAHNLALAAGVLLDLGLDAAQVEEVLASAPTVPGRMERFGGEGGRPMVIVDYAHTPDALEQVLRSAREHTQGRLWCVFGCGGERDRGKRPLMAAIAAAWADRTVVTDDNPRTESADAIVAEIVDGFPAAAHWEVERDRGRAIAHAIAEAAEDDVVVVAGKGHEDYQLVGTQVQSFSDRSTVAGLLARAWS